MVDSWPLRGKEKSTPHVVFRAAVWDLPGFAKQHGHSITRFSSPDRRHPRCPHTLDTPCRLTHAPHRAPFPDTGPSSLDSLFPMSPRLFLFAVLLATSLTLARAGEACRSVHLWYSDAPVADAFYNEVRVQESADGTYFAVCGWSRGYFGIQQLGDGRKVVIFSVWDPPAGDHPDEVPPEKRVQLLFQGDDVRVNRFGYEGTGGQSFLDFPWKTDATYRFLVTARPHGSTHVAYAGYFYLPEEGRWKHLATFATLIPPGEGLRGLYSFVEDFIRNDESTRHVRRAIYGPGWVRTGNDEWTPLLQATFTADNNPARNIDAGLAPPGFFLSTGGTTPENASLLQKAFHLPKAGKPPADLPEGS